VLTGEELRVMSFNGERSPGGALLVVSIVIAFAPVGCSDGESDPAVRITREDGTVLETDGKLRAWCGVPRSEGDPGVSLHVLEGEQAFERRNDRPAHWLFRAELNELEDRTRFAVPQTPVDTPAWVLFVYDAERDNEAAAYTEESIGSIHVEQWGCRRGDLVTLAIDARVASEIGAEALKVSGTVTVEIGDEPEGYSR
jgi:hypothetical protein